MKKHLPNAITCCNLFSGCVGIVFAFNGNLVFAAYAIFIAAIFDFFDGMVARWLNAYSAIGKELDSLADMVSFGVLPAVIIYQLFLKSTDGAISSYLSYSAFIIAVFSALRLAKFNIDTRQAENFIGLPTPANALLIASFPFIIQNNNTSFANLILNPIALFVFNMVMSYLLVSEITLISLKFKSLNFSKNIFRYVLVICSVVLLLIFKFAAVPLVIVLYLVLSVIQFRIIK